MEQPIADLNSKLEWCERGAILEQEFVSKYGENLGLCMNPGKKLDDAEGKYMPDLFSYKYSRVADLKRVTTPFFTARQYGHSPSTAITINIKDLFRYAHKYPQIIIYFWVTWGECQEYGTSVNPINGVWVASLKRIFSLPPKIHQYRGRVDDTSGNAKESLVVDLAKLMRVI